MKPEADPTQDGITHINIYSGGKTPVGRNLSHFPELPIYHPVFGDFCSGEGLWYWISRRDDRLRMLSGFEAKRYGRSLPVVKTLPKEEFQRMINLGNQAKLDTYPEIKEALANSTLPLLHYYAKSYGGKMVITQAKDSEWILAYFEKVRLQFNPAADHHNMDFVAAQARLEAEAALQGSLF
ncbi:hypothetical protein DV532_27735 (plasmid) [Pseudomonas sp. Leaf58]|uniref:hypothetical protein n=1 Tax=Pseudomonas sp. Leaf58 TaxID=1736226 RepID=UPI0006FDE497|nr:hypothetical protein [Pseudomonas sp. Leaf58]AYG48074.1 hypothetical protein DV532_27735 [Pseudomonas sp. Leaf58]KQN62372.1 hypothetical protein ASF02_09485 [Pseudomonas sp. Leaf58]